MANIGDKLTRIIATLSKDKGIEINTTQHVITRIFSENGMCIDNTYFKIYKSSIGKIEEYSIDFHAEIFIYGDSEENIRNCRDALIQHIALRVEEKLKDIIRLKEHIGICNIRYTSEVDRTPWGIDKGEN